MNENTSTQLQADFHTGTGNFILIYMLLNGAPSTWGTWTILRWHHKIMFGNVKQSFEYLWHPDVVCVKSQAIGENSVNFLCCVYIYPYFFSCGPNSYFRVSCNLIDYASGPYEAVRTAGNLKPHSQYFCSRKFKGHK